MKLVLNRFFKLKVHYGTFYSHGLENLLNYPQFLPKMTFYQIGHTTQHDLTIFHACVRS